MRKADTLIPADQFPGMNVYNARGELLGEIHYIMIDKRLGRVAYAVIAFGGFLGIGERFHPVPWTALRYDDARGGYIVNLSREQLEQAPSYGPNDAPNWEDRAYAARIQSYYNTPVH